MTEIPPPRHPTSLPVESDSLEASSRFREERAPGLFRLDAAWAPVVAFTTRLGGVSEGPYASLNLGLSTPDRSDSVQENRRRIGQSLGLGEIATIGQVHGAGLRGPATGGLAGEGDVLVTRRPDLALAVTTADCLGVVLWDEDRTKLAVVHAGWRGALAGAVETAVAWLGSPHRLRAALGPCLRVCCFEVGPEVAERFPADFVRAGEPRPHLDLPGAIRARLLRGGIDSGRVLDLGRCTACERERFYSHRRDRGVTGRHWALARLDRG